MKVRLEISETWYDSYPPIVPYINVIIEPEGTEEMLRLAKFIGRKFELERRPGCDGFTIRIAEDQP